MLHTVVDLISEEAVLRWIALRDGTEDDKIPVDKQRLFNEPVVLKFVEWIQKDEEDDDENDDEEDDDDDEEEDDDDDDDA